MFLSVAVTGSSRLAAATTGAGETDASPAAAAPAAAVWPNSRRAILSTARFSSGGRCAQALQVRGGLHRGVAKENAAVTSNNARTNSAWRATACREAVVIVRKVSVL